MWRDTKGVTALEYALIAALIGVVIVGSVTNVGSAVKKQFTAIASVISSK